MKNSIAFLFLILLNACQPAPFPPSEGQPANFSVTDLLGKKLDQVHGEQAIQLVSPLFKSLNSYGDLVKEGKIIIDGIEVHIKETKGDIVLLDLPFLYYIDPRLIRFELLFRNRLFELCRSCVIYTPTVTGSVFTGISKGVSDGSLNLPAEMTNDNVGNLYVIDQQSGAVHDRVLKITPLGITSVFAGATDEFGRLIGIAIDESRNILYVSDATSQQIKAINLASPSVITVLAGSGGAGNSNGTGLSASFNFGNSRVDNFSLSEVGQGLAIDATGNLFAGENFISSAPFSSQIRKVTPTAIVSTIPGSRIEPMSQEEAASPAGITINNDNVISYVSGSSGFFQGITQVNTSGTASRLAGRTSFESHTDGMGTRAEFTYPKAIKYFSNYYYVADGSNGALRRVSPTGEVITLAGVGHFDTPSFCSCPYVPPTTGSYNMPLLVPSGDTYYTATKLRARQIKMDQVGGIAVVNQNLIYVSDYGYRCIWKITIR